MERMENQKEMRADQANESSNVIYVDSRTGSADLVPLLHQMGYQASLETLASGDVCFAGNGPGDEPVSIGIERKRVPSDLMESIGKNRLSGFQLPRMPDYYGFIFLIIEGIWRPGRHGEMEVPRGSGNWEPYGYGKRVHMYAEPFNFLLTMTLKAGIPWIRTSTGIETAQAVGCMWKYFNEKKWSQHRSHIAVYAPDPTRVRHPNGIRQGRIGGEKFESAFVRLPPEKELVWKWAAQLPGLDERALDVARHFDDADAMFEASEEEWANIRSGGKRIGASVAQRIYRLIHPSRSRDGGKSGSKAGSKASAQGR